jgi:hypothetical protein
MFEIICPLYYLYSGASFVGLRYEAILIVTKRDEFLQLSWKYLVVKMYGSS